MKRILVLLLGFILLTGFAMAQTRQVAVSVNISEAAPTLTLGATTATITPPRPPDGLAYWAGSFTASATMEIASGQVVLKAKATDLISGTNHIPAAWLQMRGTADFTSSITALDTVDQNVHVWTATGPKSGTLELGFLNKIDVLNVPGAFTATVTFTIVKS